MSDNRKLLIRINDIGKGLFINKKFTRTPVEFITYENKLSQILIELKIRNILDFQIDVVPPEDVSKNIKIVEEKKVEKVSAKVLNEPDVEELELENLSTLDRILRTIKKD